MTLNVRLHSLLGKVLDRYVKRRKDLFGQILNEQYRIWLDNNKLTEEKLLEMKKEISHFSYRPKISIVMPVYNTEEEWLNLSIESVMKQAYPDWELCAVDDASTRVGVKKILESYGTRDSRIKVRFLGNNLGISGASNEALAIASGDFVGFLDHDDELTEDALFEIAKELNKDQHYDLIYSDEDKKDMNGCRVEPFFKPEWSPDFLLSMNYLSHFTVMRKSLIDEVGSFRSGFDGSQDYDLVLRVTELTNRIGHIPKTLYSWRRVPGSAATSMDSKPYARAAAMKAILEALGRRGLQGTVMDGFGGHYRVKYAIQGTPLVSIIIPAKDRMDLLKKCIESIESTTSYKEYEIVIVDNYSTDSTTRKYLKSLSHTIVHFDGSFNQSKINNFAVDHARGEHLLFLNDDIEVGDEFWLEAMLEHSQRPVVGVVGGLILYGNNSTFRTSRMIQQAGVVIGVDGVACDAFRYLPVERPNYFGLHMVIRNCSALGACIMVKRNVFEQVGGFDENLKESFGDVDLCLRVREKGYMIVYTPYAKLYHNQRPSIDRLRPSADETYLIDRWRDTLVKGDPYYSSNLTLLLKEKMPACI